MGLFSKIAQGLKKTRDNMAQQMDSLFKSFKKVDEELFEELEEILIMADVGMLTSERICGELARAGQKAEDYRSGRRSGAYSGRSSPSFWKGTRPFI